MSSPFAAGLPCAAVTAREASNLAALFASYPLWLWLGWRRGRR